MERSAQSDAWFRRPPRATLALLAFGILLVLGMLARSQLDAWLNARVISDLPKYPGAEEFARFTSPDRLEGSMPAPRGSVTVHYRVPGGTTPKQVQSFYESHEKLHPFDIPIASAPGGSDVQYIIHFMCVGDAYVRLDTDGVAHTRSYRVTVDHDAPPTGVDRQSPQSRRDALATAAKAKPSPIHARASSPWEEDG